MDDLHLIRFNPTKSLILLCIVYLRWLEKKVKSSEFWFKEICLEIKIITGIESLLVEHVRFVRFHGFLYYYMVFRFVMPCVVS
jgi:hypothetical protein